MSEKAAPEWLADLQSRFGAVIRTPLDRSTGTLSAVTSDYDPELVRVAGAARLAVYNRQYWFRLFEVLQATFPLTTRLLGAWQFNEYASRYLVAHAPSHWDIDRVADAFEEFLAGESNALCEACRIDRAWHDVFRAPEVSAYRPSEADAELLVDGRLVVSPAVALLVESWPLSALRRSLAAHPGAGAVPLPPPLAKPRRFALVRSGSAIQELPLESREHQLLGLLATHPLREALGIIEVESSEGERAQLPEKARVWLAKSVERGFWIGLERAGQPASSPPSLGNP